MLKQTVEYTDFDDNVCVETLYFNLTKSEITENMYLADELKAIQDMAGGEVRTLQTTEIKRILDLVKTFMRLSYGIRSADGKRFQKTPEMWEELTQTAVYDAFLFGLFEDQTKALDFMSGILPKDLREQARSVAEKEIKKMNDSEQAERAAERAPTTVTTTPPALTSVSSPEDSAESTQAAKDMEDYKAWKLSQEQNKDTQSE